MTLSDTHKTIVAVVSIATLAVGGYKYFIPRAEAAEQIAAAKAEQQKSVQELRAELLLARVKELNAKKERTPDEQLELELNLAQVKAIQAEKVAK
jgi:hypothetical protein